MIGGRHGWLGWMACLVFVVWLGFAAPAAGAEVVTGSGFIVDKSLETGLLTLSNGVVLVVTESTRIASAHGTRITLADLAVAPTTAGGGVLASGEAMVRYKGRASAGRVSAYSIQVMGKVPR